MKFGRSFHQHELPDWGTFYLDYNWFKSLFRAVCGYAQKHGADVAFPHFFITLRQGLTKVETHYKNKYTMIRKKSGIGDNSLLVSTLKIINDLNEVHPSEIGCLLGSARELLADLENLQWYGKVNRDSCLKIFCRMDEARPCNRHLFEEKVNFLGLQFASQKLCLKDIEDLNMAIVSLTRASVESTYSLSLDTSCPWHLPTYLFSKEVFAMLLDDDVSALERRHFPEPFFDNRPEVSNPYFLAVLQCAMTQGSRRCIEALLSWVGLLKSGWFPGGENLLHRHIIRLGWRRKCMSEEYQQNKSEESLELPTSSISHILDLLRPDQSNALTEWDVLGRLPLHYAAAHGLVEVCQEYLKYVQHGKQLTESMDRYPIVAEDFEGHSPLSLGVTGGHTNLVKELLEHYKTKDGIDLAKDQNFQKVSGWLLSIAVKSDFLEITQILVENHANVSFKGRCRETALYTAAQKGRENYVKAILDASACHRADLDLLDARRQWTPLFIACVEGHLSTVEILLEAGANQRIYDIFGWTAKEHAVFRGHIKTAELLTTFNAGDSKVSASSAELHTETKLPDSSLTRALRGKTHTSSSWQQSGTFLHHYPTMETKSHIFVTLGPSNTRSNSKAVDLGSCLAGHAYSVHPEIGYQLEISAINATGPSHVIDLPILEDKTNKPWLFLAKNPDRAKLVFSVFRANDYNSRSDTLIGCGIARLKSLKHGFEFGRESLIRDYTIPILENGAQDLIGTVTFSFLIVTPFPHPDVPSMAACGFWDKEGSTRVVGHRGSGANSAARTNLQIRENTVQSFLTAVDLGASCVEFEVQLTRDLVPVIFHDFLVMETGGNIPLHTLSFSQVSFCIRESLPTLEELLVKLPESIAFDIEIKYPMLWEAEDQNMDPYAIELNVFVDAILGKIYRLGGKRNITFSSFSPEICILLSSKQQYYPTLFISKAGYVPTGDIRASSLQQAIQFARRRQLAGIVMLSDMFIMCPRLVQYARRSGLVCGSYGDLNDDPKNALIQADAGLDFIIVNKVHLISTALAERNY